jgi:pyruvate dehydrogenase E1 component
MTPSGWLSRRPQDIFFHCHDCPEPPASSRRFPVLRPNISSVIAQQHPTRNAPWYAPSAAHPGSDGDRILGDIAAAHGKFGTTSPEVTVSTNLGPWINRRGIFDRAERPDTFREEHAVSAQRSAMSPQGQHIELGIAESHLFLQLAALGLAGPLFGTRLLPIGTLYDPFIKRGLDALNYACYQDARFILVATPSGITLAPEGGAHQSVGEPLTGIAQPGLASFEPAYADELAVLLRWAFEEIQREAGESVYFRLSTRPIEQPTRTSPRRSLPAPIGCARRDPAPSWR